MGTVKHKNNLSELDLIDLQIFKLKSELLKIRSAEEHDPITRDLLLAKSRLLTLQRKEILNRHNLNSAPERANSDTSR